MVKQLICERCDEVVQKLTPIINSISQTMLCDRCLVAHVAKFGAEPQLDPFARMQARAYLA